MSSNSDYASYIDTATDLAAKSWSAYADNGRIYAARWNEQSQTWGDAAAISNASGGRNVTLTAGQVIRDSDSGTTQPALVVTWEAGPGNNSDILAAVGFYQPDGSVRWSDAVNLLPGGVQESNHSIGISGDRLVVATEAQSVANPASNNPNNAKPESYQDSDINTYSLAIQARSNTVRDPESSQNQVLNSGRFNSDLVSLLRAKNISDGTLIGVQVNGIPLPIDAAGPTVIKGLGSFSISSQGRLDFDRGDNPPSELAFVGELIGTGPDGGRSYARTHASLRPAELDTKQRSIYSNEGYTLNVSTLDGSGSIIATSIVPVTFNASERRERVTSALFAPTVPGNTGRSVRDFTGGGVLSDTSLSRALQSANQATNLSRTAAADTPDTKPLLDSVTDWAEQMFWNPYQLNKGLPSRWGISFGDIVTGFVGNTNNKIPLINAITRGWEFGFDGILLYTNTGQPEQQKLNIETGLNLRLGRTVGRDQFATKNFINTIEDGTNYQPKISGPSNFLGTKKLAEKWLRGETGLQKWVYGTTPIKTRNSFSNNSRRATITAASELESENNNSTNSVPSSPAQQRQQIRDSFVEPEDYAYLLLERTSNKSLSKKDSNRASESAQNIYIGMEKMPKNGFDNFDNFLSNILSGDYQQIQNFVQGRSSQSSSQQQTAAGAKAGEIKAGYLFNIFPLRALELLFAARETYSYSTSQYYGLKDPSLISKRLQVGLGADIGLTGTFSAGFGTSTEKALTDNLNNAANLSFSIIDIQAELGLKLAVNFGVGLRKPIAAIEPALIWKKDNNNQYDYERAYLPIVENYPSLDKYLFRPAYVATQGFQTIINPLKAFGGSLYTSNISASDDRLKLVADKLKKLTRVHQGVGVAQTLAQLVSQYPYAYTSSGIIFRNLGPASFTDRQLDDVSISVKGYANASLSLLNGLISGYGRSSAGLNFVIPTKRPLKGGVGYEYNLEAGYTVGGISKTLINNRDSGTLSGDPSSFIANTFNQSSSPLSVSVYQLDSADPDGFGLSIPAAPSSASTIGGSLNLAPVLQNSNVAKASASSDLVLSIYAVVVAPTAAPVNQKGTIDQLLLILQGAAAPARVSLDQRALESGPNRLNVGQPWKPLFNQWSDPQLASSAPLDGLKPGQPVPLRIDFLLPKGTNPLDLSQIRLAYQLGQAAPKNFGSDTAPLLTWMPSSPIQRQEQGTSYELGLTASGTIGTTPEPVAPYISGFLINAPGTDFTDTDFILEEGSAVVRGRLLAAVTDGKGVSSVDLYDTSSDEAFDSDRYRSININQLKARVVSGSDAKLVLRVDQGSLSTIDIAKNAAGSGYLNGGSGRFRQWLYATPANSGDTARALLEITITNGSVSSVVIVNQQGRFADSQPNTIALTNSVAGNGSGLELIPLTRKNLDTNLLDESGVSIGSAQRYVDNKFDSNLDLVYTQGGSDRSKAINSGLNLDNPLLIHRMQRGSGWVKIPLRKQKDKNGSSYTPGIDGFNFDSASNSLYFKNDFSNGRRSVIVFSHANLSSIRSEQDLYLFEDALQNAQVYASLEKKEGNQLFFGVAEPLSDPNKPGTNSNAMVEPFYAVEGAGIAPIFDANSQLLAAWVHTSPKGQAEIQLRIGTAVGDVSTGKISWSDTRSIALPAKVKGDDVTDLSLTYLNGNTPVLSWSLNSATPYQAGVLRSKPTTYYRFDDLPSEGELGSIGNSTIAAGRLIGGAEAWRYSSWLDTPAKPLGNDDVLSADGALMPSDPKEADQPGDPNAALRFNGGGFAEVSNVYLDNLNGVSDEQPSAYSADFWLKADAPAAAAQSAVSSLLDNGLYNPAAVLPSADQLKIPVRLRRTATTETVDGIETKGYRYSLVVAADTFANLGTDGIGSGLSPFNLNFAIPQTSRTFNSASAGSKTITLPGTLLGELVQYRTNKGKLSSFTLGAEEVELNSTFEPDSSSPGTQKQDNVLTYDSQTIGIETRQIAGWSIRMRQQDGKQLVDFNFGWDQTSKRPLTLTAPLPASSDGWNHLAVSYGDEPGLNTKVARLFIDGQVAGEYIEDPKNLKGYDFNVLPYQVGTQFKGSIDELVVNNKPITANDDWLKARRITRFVDPQSAAKATFFSEASYDVKAKTWNWKPASTFKKTDYIPSTLPGFFRSAPVDMAAAASTSELRADGQEDLRAVLPLSDIAVGSFITGLRARINGQEYAIGDGLRYGMDGKASNQTVKGLIGVTASGARLNAGLLGQELDFALMGSTADLDLFLPLDPALADRPQQERQLEVVAFVQTPQNRADGQTSVWPRPNRWNSTNAPAPSFKTTVERSASTAVLRSYEASKVVSGTLYRPAPSSLQDVNTGFNTSLALTNETTLADPNKQRFAEAISTGRLGSTPFVAIANPTLDGLAGSGSKRGVVWVLRYDLDPKASTDRTKATATKLQALQSLVSSPAGKFERAQIDGLAIVGRDGQQIGSTMLWADLNGDGDDDLVLASPAHPSSSGEVNSGQLVVINGQYIRKIAASGSKLIDLASESDPKNIRVFGGADASEFGTALAFGKLSAAGHSLVIGAPGYRAEVSTDAKAQPIPAAQRKSVALGAVFKLDVAADLFSSSSDAKPLLFMSGDLPGMANWNAGADPTNRRFGASLSITSAERDFSGDGIADLVVGIPGLMQSRQLKGGISIKATAAQRDAELQLRSNMPDVYREGIDESTLSDPVEKQMGGVLLIQGGTTVELAKKILLFGETVFGDAAAAGSAVATGGDFGGDGYIDDLAIGMPQIDAMTGAVALISGEKIRSWFASATPDSYAKETQQRSSVLDAALIIPGNQPNGSYGRHLNLSGDVDGDGKSDLIIGDSAFIDGTGRVNVLFGSTGFGSTSKGQIAGGDTLYHNLNVLNPELRLDLYPGSRSEGLGHSVALLPGQNNASDLLLPTSNGSSTLTTLYGKPRLRSMGSFSSRDLASSDGIEIDGLSRRVATRASFGLLGDVNGDGISDALVDLDSTPGKPSFKLSFGMGAGLSPEHGGSGTGGTSLLDLAPVLALQHPNASQFSLQDVRSAGDLNSDGINDLLLSYNYNSNGRTKPASSVLLGGDLLTSTTLLQAAVFRPIQPAASAAAGSVLRSGDTLLPNEYLLSPNGRYMALMTEEGDFVVRTLSPDGNNWNNVFSLINYYKITHTATNNEIPSRVVANTKDSSVVFGRTPGTRLEIRGGSVVLVNDRFLSQDGSKAIVLSEGGYRDTGGLHDVTTRKLPEKASFQTLSLKDDGVLEAKASDGTVLFTYQRSSSTLGRQDPIPDAKLKGLTLKISLDADPRPFGIAPVGANGGVQTLLALSEAAGIAALRTIETRARVLDVGQLYDQWFAGFKTPDPSDTELIKALNDFNTKLKKELKSVDSTAINAALLSSSNLDLVSGVLNDLSPNAAVSFRNFVEAKVPSYQQRTRDLLTPQARNLLLPGQRLKPGEHLLSPNGHFMAVMQRDGNFVVYASKADGKLVASFSLNDYYERRSSKPPLANIADSSVKLGSTPNTSLEIRNGLLTFVNDRFRSADGSNAIALTAGGYTRYGKKHNLNIRPLPASARFDALSLTDNGVLEAKASDGTILFGFSPNYGAGSGQQPIPAASRAGLNLPAYYERLNLSARQLILSDRNGDGSKELLIAPTPAAHNQRWYRVDLGATPADPLAPWMAEPITANESSPNNHLLWESRSNGSKPANDLQDKDAGASQLLKINGFAEDFITGATPNGSPVSIPIPGKPVESGGFYGVNGASLSRSMLHLHAPHTSKTWGAYSRRIGGLDLNQRLQKQGESFELKVPAYVWQMKSKGDGKPKNEGADELVLHIGSGLGSRDRAANTDSGTIGLDGLAINFDEYDNTLRIFWNGKLLWQAGPGSSTADLAKVLRSSNANANPSDTKNNPGEPLSDKELNTFLKEFMLPDGGLHNATGIDTGYELMSNIGEWFANLMSSGVYLRYQKAAQPFTQKDASGKDITYQGNLIFEAANAIRYTPFEKGTISSTPRLNALNKGLQVVIPIEKPLALSGSDVVFNAYARSDGWPGVHALAGVEVNFDKPLEGINLDRLTAVGDLNGDGYEDQVGLGTLATGWNIDYKLDLPHNNLSERNGSSDNERSFTVSKGANGEGYTRSTLIAPVILWGGQGAPSSERLTPIVRGSETTYSPNSPTGLAAVDNFSAADNVMIAPMGDLNADGFDDLAISDVELGLTYVLHGGTGLDAAKSYLDRFGSFFKETRAKDRPNESADIYLQSSSKGFGAPLSADQTPAAWFAGINLERSAQRTSNNAVARPAFGGIQVTKITGLSGQQIANLSGAADFSGDGINDLFLTSQPSLDTAKALSQQAPSRFVLFGGDNTRSYTHVGTANNDSTRGTPVNDVIITMAGNDIVQGLGGLDAISTGPGDDQILLPDDQFRRIDAGSGTDTLRLQGQRNQSWDFTKLASAGRLRSIEQLDVSDYGSNQLTLNASAVAALSGNGGSLVLNGDLHTEKPAVVLVRALKTRLQALDPNSLRYDAILDAATRYGGLSFGLSDLSMVPVVLRDVQRDRVLDSLRSFSGQTSKRPLSDLLDRLNAIDPQRQFGLALDFLKVFSQRLAFTHASALNAYEAWLADLPKSVPDAYAKLSALQKTELAALPKAWRAAYPASFPAPGAALPAAEAFELFSKSTSNTATTVAGAYTQWLATSGSAYRLPPDTDTRQQQLLQLLNQLETLAPELIKEVLGSYDSVRLSSEFSLANADVLVGSDSFSEYTAAAGTIKLLIPEWMAVVLDPDVPLSLTPTPATRSSSSAAPAPNTRAERPLTSAAPPATKPRPDSLDDLRVSVGESRLSDDGRALRFSLTRSGYLSGTTRVEVNTEGYVADLVANALGQVVFAPGQDRQDVLIPLMANLPQERQALDPYAVDMLRDVSVRLNLLPQTSSGPRTTSVVGLNALNATTPELEQPSRPLSSAQRHGLTLFERNVALQFSKTLWLTAIANDARVPIQFGFDNPQGQQLNDVRLVDRFTGDLVSIFDAASAGSALIYGDNAETPSTDLYFSVDDGGRFDQDALANGRITLAAIGAHVSPGSTLIGERVLRAPSTNGSQLLLTTPDAGFSGPLAAYRELLLIPADDIGGSLSNPNGSNLTPSAGEPYLQALSQRLSSAAEGIRSIRLDQGSRSSALHLLNDTNYVAVLSKAAHGTLATATDLRLPSLRDLNSTSSRAFTNYQLQLDNQRLSFTLSSPYYVVPGIEGEPITLTTEYRAPSGLPAGTQRPAWLRVDTVNGDLMALLRSDNLADRLITLPPAGSVSMIGGDILLPLVFQGIDPARWAALPPAQRRLQGTDPATGTWRVDLPEPSLNAAPLLRRSQANAYQFGLDGTLVLRYGSTHKASLLSGKTVLGTPAADRFSTRDTKTSLSFQHNLIVTGDGNDLVAAPNDTRSADNVVLTGRGDDQVSPLRGDIVYSGTGADRVTLRGSGGNRLDTGDGNDTVRIETGGHILSTGPGRDFIQLAAAITTPVVIAGGADGDLFWLADSQGNLPAATVVITDFDRSQGDRLVLPGRRFSDLVFEQTGGNVQISIGSTTIAILINRTLEQVADERGFRFDANAQTQAVDFGASQDPLAPVFGDGVLTTDELISDGVNGLVSYARRTFGNTSPELAVYIHTSAGQTTVGGGRTGRKTIKTVAISPNDADWMRQQIRQLDSVLGIKIRFVSSSSESNLDIYYDEALSLSSDRSTLGVSLANDNGRQSWWELMLNASALSGNPTAFRYTFLHELGHVLGLEHGWDDSDGDAEGQRFAAPDAATTMMSYTRPDAGWPASYSSLDWAALVRVWGLDPANSSGWRFRNADGTETLLDSKQALARLTAAKPGDQFLGRADGLISSSSKTSPATPHTNNNSTHTTNDTTNTAADAIQTTPKNKRIEKTIDPKAPLTSSLPVLVTTEPLATNLTPTQITWDPLWRELDLELGVARDAKGIPQILNPASYGSTPRNGHQLVDLQLSGSSQPDVLIASSGVNVDLGLGEDVIFSGSASGGGNRLYGGPQADRFLLSAPGDNAYGGLSIPGSSESITDGSANSFLIAREPHANIHSAKPIAILDFQPGRDTLTLIGSDPSSNAPLPITPANYRIWRDQLLKESNLLLNAAPQVRHAKRTLNLSQSTLQQQGFQLAVHDLFSDLDANTLTFEGLSHQPAWLQLLNGSLTVRPGSSIQPGLYDFAVSASDGNSRTPLTNIQLIVNGAGTGGSGSSSDSGRSSGLFTTHIDLDGQRLPALHLPSQASRMGRGRRTPLSGHQLRLSMELQATQHTAGTFRLYLADRITGAVMDPKSGALLSSAPFDALGNPSDSYLKLAAAHALVSANVTQGSTSAYNHTIALNSDLLLDNAVLLPLVTTQASNGNQSYMAGSFGNIDRQQHLDSLKGNSFGFELHLDDKDTKHDDIIAKINFVDFF